MPVELSGDYDGGGEESMNSPGLPRLTTDREGVLLSLAVCQGADLLGTGVVCTPLRFAAVCRCS